MSRGLAERHPEAQDTVNHLAATFASLPSDTFNYSRPAARERGGPRVNRLSFTTIKPFFRGVHNDMWHVGQTATGIILSDDTV